MRKLILIASMVIAGLGLNAQSIDITQTENPEVASQFINYQNIDEVVLVDGSVIKVGDKIQLVGPYKGKRDFTNVFIAKLNVAIMLISSPTHLDQIFANKTTTVEKIFVNHTGFGKKSPLNISMHVNFDGITLHATIFDLKGALEDGEIIINK
jgi:hypothetical protein